MPAMNGDLVIRDSQFEDELPQEESRREDPLPLPEKRKKEKTFRRPQNRHRVRINNHR